MRRAAALTLCLALLYAAIIGGFWHPSEKPKMRDISAFTDLMKEIKPVLLRKNRPKISPTHAPETSTAISSAARDLESYIGTLSGFQTRFAALKTNALTPCQRDEFYRYWGALNHWQFWADRQAPQQTPERLYEAEALQFTGLPLDFGAFKARGEAEFQTVTDELDALARRVQTEYGETLEIYAARPEHYSETDAELTPRLGAELLAVEAAFKDDFAFAPVPAAAVISKAEFGPYYSMASYSRNDNAMVVYWQNKPYNHRYDTMLAVHEIMPGHHQQIAMKKKQSCTTGPISAPLPFLEGWASYAEVLADERGLFTRADQRLGWLDYRLIRAMRIILDTQRTQDALTKPQARSLWERRMPPRLHELFEREWARITQTRQHLTYIFGADAILTARTHVKSTQGDHYSEAAFHAALLNSQHRSLAYLGPRMNAQIEARNDRGLRP